MTIITEFPGLYPHPNCNHRFLYDCMCSTLKVYGKSVSTVSVWYRHLCSYCLHPTFMVVRDDVGCSTHISNSTESMSSK